EVSRAAEDDEIEGIDGNGLAGHCLSICMACRKGDAVYNLIDLIWLLRPSVRASLDRANGEAFHGRNEMSGVLAHAVKLVRRCPGSKEKRQMGAHLSRTVAEGLAFMQIVDGKPVDSLSGQRIDVASPSDGKV